MQTETICILKNNIEVEVKVKCIKNNRTANRNKTL